MSKPTRQRRGWERLRGGCGGIWRHVASGWVVRHCGHPTALWPYYGKRSLTEPDNDDKSNMLLYGGWGLGLAFQRLADAQEAVEQELLNQGA